MGRVGNQKLGLVLILIILMMVSSYITINELAEERDDPKRITIARTVPFGNFSHILNFLGGLPWLPMVHAGLYSRIESPLKQWEADLADGDPLEKDNHDGTAILHVKLKENLKFASGASITMEDVIFSYRVVMTPMIDRYSAWTILSEFFANNDSISIDGELIKFDFKTWNIFSKRVLNIPIIEEAVYRQVYDECVSGIAKSCNWDRDDGFFTQGAGPYKFESYSNQTDELMVTKNPNYWDSKNVFIDEILFKVIPSLSSALELHENTTIDIYSSQYNPNSTTFGSEIELYAAPSLVSDYIMVNHIHPLVGTGVETPLGIAEPSDADLAAKSIRKAFAHSMNRSWIASEVYDGKAIPAVNGIPPGVDGFDKSLPVYAFDTEVAKSYMEDAGYNYADIDDLNDDGIYESFFFNITLLTGDHDAARITYATRFANNLLKIGVSVDTRVIPFSPDLLARLFTPGPQPVYSDGGYDLMAIGESTQKDYDPYHNYTKTWPYAFNLNNYVNESLAEIIDQYWIEFDLAARNSVFEDMQFHFYDNVVNIPAVYLIPTYGVHCRALDVADRLEFPDQVWKNIEIDYELCPDGIKPANEGNNLLSSPTIFYILPGGISAIILTVIFLNWFVNTKIRSGIKNVDKIKQEEVEKYYSLAKKIADEEE